MSRASLYLFTVWHQNDWMGLPARKREKVCVCVFAICSTQRWYASEINPVPCLPMRFGRLQLDVKFCLDKLEFFGKGFVHFGSQTLYSAVTDFHSNPTSYLMSWTKINFPIFRLLNQRCLSLLCHLDIILLGFMMEKALHMHVYWSWRRFELTECGIKARRLKRLKALLKALTGFTVVSLHFKISSAFKFST